MESAPWPTAFAGALRQTRRRKKEGSNRWSRLRRRRFSKYLISRAQAAHRLKADPLYRLRYFAASRFFPVRSAAKCRSTALAAAALGRVPDGGVGAKSVSLPQRVWCANLTFGKFQG